MTNGAGMVPTPLCVKLRCGSLVRMTLVAQVQGLLHGAAHSQFLFAHLFHVLPHMGCPQAVLGRVARTPLAAQPTTHAGSPPEVMTEEAGNGRKCSAVTSRTEDYAEVHTRMNNCLGR